MPLPLTLSTSKCNYPNAISIIIQSLHSSTALYWCWKFYLPLVRNHYPPFQFNNPISWFYIISWVEHFHSPSLGSSISIWKWKEGKFYLVPQIWFFPRLPHYNTGFFLLHYEFTPGPHSHLKVVEVFHHLPLLPPLNPGCHFLKTTDGLPVL